MFGVPAGELAVLAAAIVLGGLITGLLAGLFGVGGGAIIVPVLYEIFRAVGVAEAVQIKLCVGTSLAIILPTSIRSFRAHRARGGLPVDILRIWILPVFAGVVLGAIAAAYAPAYVFRLIFVFVAALMGAKFLFAQDSWRLGEKLPGHAAMGGYGLAIGLYSALMGVGGGALATIVLTLYGVSMHFAVGISAGIGVIYRGVGDGRVYSRGPAIPGTAAAVLDRFRLAARCLADGADQRARRAGRRAAGACAAAAASSKSPSGYFCCWCRCGLSSV